MPPNEMRPWVGRSPYSPQKLAGMRTEPPVSDPRAKSTRPPATAAADPLEELLDERELLDPVGLAVTDHHVRLPTEDRLHEVGDVAPGVLVIGVGVDDDVRPQTQGCIESRLEGRRESFVAAVPDYMLHAELSCCLAGPIGAAVVDHEPFDAVDPVDVRGEVGKRLRQDLLFVVAGDLDYQFHESISRQEIRRPGARCRSGRLTPTPARAC